MPQNVFGKDGFAFELGKEGDGLFSPERVFVGWPEVLLGISSHPTLKYK